MAICYANDLDTALTAPISGAIGLSMYIPNADVTNVRSALHVGTERPNLGTRYGHFVPLVIDDAGALSYVRAETTSGVNDRLLVSSLDGFPITAPAGAAVRCCPISQFSAVPFVQGDEGYTTARVAFGVRTRNTGQSGTYALEFPSYSSVNKTTQYMRNDDSDAVVELSNGGGLAGTLTFPIGLTIIWDGGVVKDTFPSTVKLAVYTFRMIYPASLRTTFGAQMYAKAEFYS